MTHPTDRLAEGMLARSGCLSADALALAREVIARAEADGIETVRVLFCDPHGTLRGKTVVTAALPSVFREGVALPSTVLLKDTSQRTVFPVWSGDAGFGSGALVGAGDVVLAPDPASFRRMPWSPHSALMLADVVTKEGAPIAFAPRSVLREAETRLSARGLAMVVGLEVEFHCYHAEAAPTHADAGMPGRPPQTAPLTTRYSLCDSGHYDTLEPLMDTLRRACDALGLPVRSMEPEFGPSQLEFVFEPDGAMAQADAMVVFRTMVKQMCAREGYHATFMCRPALPNAAASGWHLHQSLVDASGANRFVPDEAGALSPTASAWIAGLLEHAAASCVFTTPSVNGYKRYQPFQLAPDRIQWAVDNKGAMLRGLMRPGDGASRIENRVPEPAANPYFVIASQIFAGLDGLARGLTAPPPAETPYTSDAPSLPKTLADAIAAFEASPLYADALGRPFVDYIARLKRAEWERYVSAVSEWEQAEYFSLF